jgi:hypothetical protein
MTKMLDRAIIQAGHKEVAGCSAHPPAWRICRESFLASISYRSRAEGL